MKVALVCPSHVPPTRGGAERVWDGIVHEINARTPHAADLVAVESPERTFEEVVKSYARFDALDVSGYDLVISTKYPAWMVGHPNHVVYMQHPLRGLYDTYQGALALPATGMSREAIALVDALRSSNPGSRGARDRVLECALLAVDTLAPDHPDLAFPGPVVRLLVRWLDRDALSPDNTVAHLAISRTVATRPGYFPEPSRVEVALHPSNLEGLAPGVGRNLFTASRLDGPKRVDMLIDAMAFVEGDVQLRIAGTGPQERSLRQRAASDPRIRFLGYVDDAELAQEYASAIAVPFVPLDEDFGLVTLEAQMCHKPVVTCTDSGGATEMVRDGVEGFVVRPNPRDLGKALQRLISDRALAQEMGARGFDRGRKVTWDKLLDALLRDRTLKGRHVSEAPDVVVLSTYPAEPARHGGQVRLNRLLRSLATRANVHLLACGSADEPTHVSPRFRQTTVAPDRDFHSVDHLLAEATGVPTGDIAAALASDHLGDLARLVADIAPRADVVVLAHPYLFPLVSEFEDACIVYDAHNAEFDLKRSMYATTEAGTAVADAVREVEAATLRRSALVTCTSADDLDALRRLSPTLADFAVIPNGTDTFDRAFVTGDVRRSRRDAYIDTLRREGLDTTATAIAVFVGSGHPPNVQAALRTLEIAQDLPSVLFVFVGSHVDALPGVPIGRNVIASGVVGTDELHRVLASCDVALNPMATGSGTNIKMLDYFAAGAPVVSTAIGARGMGAVPDLHYMETDLDRLAGALVTTIEDPVGADQRALRARALAERFDWSALGEQFTESVLRACSARADSSPTSSGDS